MTRPPRIGITMRLELPTDRFYLGRDYSESIEAAGGIPVHIALIPKAEYISAMMDDLDGILLPGSNTDVDPHLYGHEPHPKLGTVIPAKDQTDMLVLDEVECRGLPLLAICFGMQVLNVHRGGTLIQDIESQVKDPHKHEQGPPATRVSHSINVGEQGIIASLDAVMNSAGPIRVNSSHHQAVDKVGADLIATAWAKDGVIEAVEDVRADRFTVGVQWHPELLTGHDELSRELFRKFVAECTQRAISSTAASG
ncbi:MAG TPA: gamma-glutamyl-gamma-aminobutyrate hydrolase family protein [Pyrinomonadaceae bacterium]|nr:gamma-glutamyl-gamma-aminobutyrate hydrolase family protein [Pyrinomonadaceae bacterium]